MNLRLSIIVALLSLQTVAAQDNYIGFSAGSDIKNAGKDLIFQVNMVSSDVEINASYESHAALDFTKYSFGLGYHFPLYAYPFGNEVRTVFVPSIEPSLINRTGDWGGGLDQNETSSHLSIGLNLALQWSINDYLSVEYCFNALPRTDLKTKYPDSIKNYTNIGGVPIVGSNFLKIVYKIQMN